MEFKYEVLCPPPHLTIKAIRVPACGLKQEVVTRILKTTCMLFKMQVQVCDLLHLLGVGLVLLQQLLLPL